jgi:hypothetical protein
MQENNLIDLFSGTSVAILQKVSLFIKTVSSLMLASTVRAKSGSVSCFDCNFYVFPSGEYKKTWKELAVANPREETKEHENIPL